MTTRKNSKSKARSLKGVAGFKDINVVTLSYDGSTVIKNKALQKSIIDRIKLAKNIPCLRLCLKLKPRQLRLL